MKNKGSWKEKGKKKQREWGEFVGGAGRRESTRKRSGGRGAKMGLKAFFSQEIQKEEKRRRVPKARWFLEQIGRWLLSSMMIGQSLVEVEAASENA